MSTVFYRWGAGRDESRITFDGTHISVFDLKREIILVNKMGHGKDFDLGLFDNLTGEEFKDDDHQIPRSSSLIARRMPAQAKGRGNAQNYIVGTTAADALNNDHRIENHARDAMAAKANKGARFGGGHYGSMTKRFDGGAEGSGMPGKDKVEISTGDAEEDKRIQAFFAQSGDQWEQTQEDMSTAPGRQAQFRRQQRPGPPPGANGAGGGANSGATGGSSAGKFDFSMPPDKEPPVGYICYRCGQKGHWIQDCPTNDDPAAQERKRFVRVTGIPRSFLKTVEAPVGAEGSSGGAMLTADGGFVMAVPDQRQWQKHASTKKRADNDNDGSGIPPELTCPIDRVLLRDAVQTPCCRTAFCEECITTHLVEHDFECPQCESKVASLAKLRPDEEARERVREFGQVKEEDAAAAEVVAEQPAATGEQGVEVDEAMREKVREAEEVASEPEEGAISPTEEQAPIIRPGPSVPTNAPLAAPVKPILDPIKMREMLKPQVMNNYTTQVAKMLQNPSLHPQAKILLRAQQQLVQATVVQMQVMGMMGLGGPGGGGGPGMTQQQPGMMPGPQNGMNGQGMNPAQQGMMMTPNQMGGGMMGMGMPMNQGMGMGMQGMGMGMGMGNGMNMGMGMGGSQGMGMPTGGGFRGRGGFAPRGLTGGFRGRGGFGPAGTGRGGHMMPVPVQLTGGMPGGGRAPLPKRQAEEAGFEVPAGLDKFARTG